MHHQRSACEASTSASIGQPSHGQEGPVGDRTSTRQPTSSAGVQRDHRRVVAAAPVSTPPRARPSAALRSRDDELGEPLQADRRAPARRTSSSLVHAHGRLTSAAAPARSRSRAPSPAARPGVPGRRRLGRRGCRASTCSTEDDDRLPTCGQRDARSRRGRARRQAEGRVAWPRAPWGRRGGQPRRARRRSSGRGRRGRRRRRRRGTPRRPRRRSAESTIRKPVLPMSQPITRSVSG